MKRIQALVTVCSPLDLCSTMRPRGHDQCEQVSKQAHQTQANKICSETEGRPSERAIDSIVLDSFSLRQRYKMHSGDMQASNLFKAPSSSNE